jgi:prophage regulatory protein
MNIELMKKDQVLAICAISNATLYRMIKQGSFPEPVSPTGGRSVAWIRSEVEQWIKKRPRVHLATKNPTEMRDPGCTLQ